MSKSKVADSTAKDVDVPMVEVKVKPNTIDAAIVSLSQLEWWGEMDWNSRLGFIMPILVHVASQTIQFVVLYYFYMFTLEALEDPFEDVQFNWISKSIDTSILTDTPLSKLTAIAAKNNNAGYPAGTDNMNFYTAVHDMCAGEIASLWANGLALILFTSHVIFDICDIFSQMYTMSQLESDGDGPEDGIDLNKLPPKNVISTMALPLKLVAVVFILLPHLVCHIGIAFAGSKLIALGTAPFGVIKGFLKIFFVAKIDLQLYIALTSTKFAAYAKVTVYSIKKEKKSGAVEIWGTAASTFLKVVIAALWVYLCLFVICPNLSEYRGKCAEYYTQFKNTGYGDVIDHEHCIYGNAMNPLTKGNFSESCGGAFDL